MFEIDKDSLVRDLLLSQYCGSVKIEATYLHKLRKSIKKELKRELETLREMLARPLAGQTEEYFNSVQGCIKFREELWNDYKLDLDGDDEEKHCFELVRKRRV